jgi:hypothetical protein
VAWGRVGKQMSVQHEAVNAQHSRGWGRANTTARGPRAPISKSGQALQIEPATTETLRQVPQSRGIPSHDGTQGDNFGRAAGRLGRLGQPSLPTTDNGETAGEKGPLKHAFCETNPNVICKEQGISDCCEGGWEHYRKMTNGFVFSNVALPTAGRPRRSPERNSG